MSEVNELGQNLTAIIRTYIIISGFSCAGAVEETSATKNGFLKNAMEEQLKSLKHIVTYTFGNG